MTQYDNTNRGFLRKNDRKEKETQPDYRGEVDVNGQSFWLSAWLNEHEKMGGKYFQLSVQPKEPQQSKHNQQKSNGYQPQQNDFDDEIPFN